MAGAGSARSGACQGCRDSRFAVPITMAFQPILDEARGRVFAYEALVRGPDGQGASHVLTQVNPANRYGFDQTCRVRAIELAARLGVAARGALLSINFLPNAVYRPEACIRSTLEAARRTGFPVGNILFEVTEGERIEDIGHLKSILRAYREMGFRTAIDDFGARHSGLNLLADFQPDLIKLDMELVRGIGGDRPRRAIVAGVVAICAELGIGVVAEGVETADEHRAVRDLGISLLQGYRFARPGLECLPEPVLPVEPAPS